MANIGYIYSITPINSDDSDGDVYYGSTDNILSRLNTHKYQYNNNIKNCNSYILFDKYGFNNCHINIIEEIKYNNKSELLYRERFYIDNNECINKKSPIKTKEEILNDKKEYKTIFNTIETPITQVYLSQKGYALPRLRPDGKTPSSCL